MKCEYCSNDHDGSFGSGRFCDNRCAAGFATKNKRSEINKKVSETLKGRPQPHLKGYKFKKGFDPNRVTWNEENKQRAVQTRRSTLKKLYETLDWFHLPLPEKKRRVFTEQETKCVCGINSWNGEPLTLELHHKNGNKNDNSRENLVYLCPNCHSQTEGWRKKKNVPL